MWVYKDCMQNDIRWKKFELGVPYWLPLQVSWAEKFSAPTSLTISHFGWCKTFNMVDTDEMFDKYSIADHLRNQAVEKTTSKIVNNPPYYTYKKTAGYNGYIQTINNRLRFCDFSYGCNYDSAQTTIVVHSPYEMPDIRHRRFVIGYLEFSKITIEAQIKITDETLLSLDVDE